MQQALGITLANLNARSIGFIALGGVIINVSIRFNLQKSNPVLKNITTNCVGV